MGSLFALILGLSPPAPVETPPPADFTLDWQAPESCPSGEGVEALVAELVGDRVDGEGTMIVTGVVTREDGGYHLELTTVVGEREGLRELRSQHCEELANSLALVVAVTLVPDLADPPTEATPDDAVPTPTPTPQREPEPDPEPRPESEPQSDPQPPPAPQPRPTRVRRAVSTPSPFVRAGVGIDIGGNPAPALASRLSLGVGWHHLRVAIEGTHLSPQRALGSSGTAGLVQQGTVGALACGVLHAKPWSFPFCGGVELGLLRADSRGVDPEATATGLLANPIARAGALRSWGRVGLWFDAELLIRGATTKVVIANDEIFRPNPAWFRALAGIEISLGGKSRSAGQGS